ncbi:MAG: GNAT family N-acetyltransferase [Bacillota bacterium]
MTNLTLFNELNEEDTYFLRYNLIKFNKSKVEYTEEEKINLVLKDDDGQILGGLVGHTDWDCFFIDVLWVDESLRGQRKGQELIQLAEKVAKEKGCTLMRLETFSFQAPDFYKKLGFVEMGKMENFPKGHTHYYLYKKLD